MKIIACWLGLSYNANAWTLGIIRDNHNPVSDLPTEFFYFPFHG